MCLSGECPNFGLFGSCELLGKCPPHDTHRGCSVEAMKSGLGICEAGANVIRFKDGVPIVELPVVLKNPDQ